MNTKNTCPTSPLDITMDYRTFFDLANIFLVILDRHGKVAMINPKGCEVLGYKMDEVVGQDWFKNFLPKGQQRQVSAAFAKIMGGKFNSFQVYENFILTKGGEKKLIRWNNTFLKNAKGQVDYTFSTGEDITQIKKPHHCGMMATDLKGKILDVNKKGVENLGLPKKQILKMTLFDFCPPSAFPTLKKALGQAAKSGFNKYDINILTKGDKPTPCKVSTSCLNLGGKILVSCF